MGIYKSKLLQNILTELVQYIYCIDYVSLRRWLENKSFTFALDKQKYVREQIAYFRV